MFRLADWPTSSVSPGCLYVLKPAASTVKDEGNLFSAPAKQEANRILADIEQHLKKEIHVEAYNPALRLYERLGFVHADTNGVYLFMRWTPPQVNTTS